MNKMNKRYHFFFVIVNKTRMRAPCDLNGNDKRKLLNKKELMNEMYACKDCDCAGYPWCVYQGGLCEQCVDIKEYVHKRPLRSTPGVYSSDESVKQDVPKVKYPYLNIVPTSLDGDCLYSAISLAFDGKVSVKDLRYLVAMSQTDETHEAYKQLSAYMPEYLHVRSTHSLRDFRVLIKKCGDDVGVQNCMWGDENALQIISTRMRLGIKIFNEKGQYIQQIIPEKTSNFDDRIPSKYVLLMLNSSKPGNEHYNLLEFNKNKLLTLYEWEKMKRILNEKRRINE